MKIAGLQKTTLIDYPGKVAAIIFTQGCPFRCGFCYNPELLPIESDNIFATSEVLEFLDRRKGLLDALVITGGEPTMQKDLPQFIKKVKDMGYLVKLDTNGVNPEMLRDLVNDKLIDYIAMDIKGPINKYKKVVNAAVDEEKILESIDFIMSSGIDYEFRSTILPKLHSEKDLQEMAKTIQGAKKYYLQKFLTTSRNLQDESFLSENSFTDQEMKDLTAVCAPFVGKCEVR